MGARTHIRTHLEEHCYDGMTVMAMLGSQAAKPADEVSQLREETTALERRLSGAPGGHARRLKDKTAKKKAKKC